MAKIIQYAQQTEPSLRGVPAANANPEGDLGAGYLSRSLGQLSGGLSDLGAGMREKEDADARTWVGPVLSDARVQWTEYLQRKQEEAKDGAEGFTPAVLADYDAYMDKAVDSAPNDSTKAFMEDRLLALREDLAGKSMEFEAKARVVHRERSIDTSIDTYAKLMNADPTQYDKALAEQLAVIDGSALGPERREAKRQKAITDISSAAVWSQIQASPTKFLDSLGFYSVDRKTRASSGDLVARTGNTPFDILPFDKRVQMFDLAIRQKNQIEADADRAAAGRPVKSNPTTFRHLQELETHDVEAARDYALTAHAKGLLSNEDLKEALGPYRDKAKQMPDSEYERSRNFIKGSLDPGPFVQDPVGRARFAEAADTFDRWFVSGKHTDQEIMDRGREIVKQFQFINMRDTVAGLPSPRVMNINRTAEPAAILDQVRQAGLKVQDQLHNGDITKDEYDSEMGILNRWRTAVTQ